MRKLRMIVLDDDELMLMLFKSYFDRDSYEVITSRNPVVCFFPDTRRNACPDSRVCADVFITDYAMPGMNGLQVITEQIRSGCPLNTRNKALITGMYNDELLRETKKLGLALFEKPFSFATVKAWVLECAQRIDLAKPLAAVRREPRTYTSQKAHVTAMSGRRMEASIVNLSDSGLCLALRSPLAHEERVFINRSASGEPRAAAVRWSRAGENGLYLVGLHYA